MIPLFRAGRSHNSINMYCFALAARRFHSHSHILIYACSVIYSMVTSRSILIHVVLVIIARRHVQLITFLNPTKSLRTKDRKSNKKEVKSFRQIRDGTEINAQTSGYVNK